MGAGADVQHCLLVRGICASHEGNRLMGNCQTYNQMPRSARSLPDHVDRTAVRHLEEYEQWYAADRKPGAPSGRHAVDPAKIRRIVIMRRTGASWSEIARLLGMSGTSATNYYNRLPDHLK